MEAALYYAIQYTPVYLPAGWLPICTQTPDCKYCQEAHKTVGNGYF